MSATREKLLEAAAEFEIDSNDLTDYSERGIALALLGACGVDVTRPASPLANPGDFRPIHSLPSDALVFRALYVACHTRRGVQP